jgi:hypothetical protein
LDESFHVGFKSTNGAQMQGTLKHGNDILLFHSKNPESQPLNQKGESSVKKLVTNETSDEKLKLIFETSTIFENIQKNNELSTNATFYRVFLTEYQNSFDKNDKNFSVAHFQKMLFHLVECVSYNDSHLLTKVFSFFLNFKMMEWCQFHFTPNSKEFQKNLENGNYNQDFWNYLFHLLLQGKTKEVSIFLEPYIQSLQDANWEPLVLG